MVEGDKSAAIEIRLLFKYFYGIIWIISW